MDSVILMNKMVEALKKEFLMELSEKHNELDRVYGIQQIANTRNIINETISKVLEKNNIGISNGKAWIYIILEDGRIIYAFPHLECLRPILKLSIER